ncbi:hypothetical protein [Levilactobacillus yonginensis]|uniref:hypothetical protein n=1 Tax=Levilactobacillus yonginensis TaxID=1054041 RepID=UPI00345D9A4B
MIIATGSVDINEATKLAQEASDSADDLAKKMKNTVATMDGKTTVSTSTPFDDGKEHNEGDMWTVINDDVASAMYIYTSGEWKAKKWDQQALSVKQLSALTADLGHVTAGTLESATIIGGSITGSTIHLSSGTDEYWLDYNGFHTTDTAENTGTWVMPGLIDLGGSKANPRVMVSANGIYSGAQRISTQSLTMSAGSVFGTTSGDVYFEIGGGDSGQGGAALHAASFNKMSQLSVKRNLADVSGEYALAQISGTDVKRYDYKDSDNSQQTNIGPVIDDVNSNGNKAYNISSDLINKQTDGVSIDNEVGLLMAAVKELTKRNSELTMRVAKLERKMQE